MNRIQDIQEQHTEEIARLRERAAAQDTFNTSMKEDIQELTRAVHSLTSTIDRSKGALWVILGASGTVGGVTTAVAEFILRK